MQEMPKVNYQSEVGNGIISKNAAYVALNNLLIGLVGNENVAWIQAIQKNPIETLSSHREFAAGVLYGLGLAMTMKCIPAFLTDEDERIIHSTIFTTFGAFHEELCKNPECEHTKESAK